MLTLQVFKLQAIFRQVQEMNQHYHLLYICFKNSYSKAMDEPTLFEGHKNLCRDSYKHLSNKEQKLHNSCRQVPFLLDCGCQSCLGL